MAAAVRSAGRMSSERFWAGFDHARNWLCIAWLYLRVARRRRGVWVVRGVLARVAAEDGGGRRRCAGRVLEMQALLAFEV